MNRSSYDGSWHGGKGSRTRKTDKDSYDTNYGLAFGNTMTWLARKKIYEAWERLCLS